MTLLPIPAPRVSPEQFSRLSRKARSSVRGLLTVLVLVAAVTVAKADPVGVSFTATQLSASQWQYDYTLSGSFTTGEDLAIYFPSASCADLAALGSGSADWSTFVLQPDSAPPADGEFDLVAQTDTPSLASLFSATFTYSGSGAPGPQTFALYDEAFNQIASGSTSPSDVTPAPVPEPSSLVLLASGAAAFWKLKRSRSL